MTECPEVLIIPVYYPGRGVHICHCCKEQVMFFEDLDTWSHVPTS